MTIISSKEFASNQGKYFDLAVNEQVIVQRGSRMFLVQNFVQDAVKFEPRQGWAEAFRSFAALDREEVFFPDVFEDEDLSWWQWKK